MSLVTPALKIILINTVNTYTVMFRLYSFTHLKSMGSSVFNKLMPLCVLSGRGQFLWTFATTAATLVSQLGT